MWIYQEKRVQPSRIEWIRSATPCDAQQDPNPAMKVDTEEVTNVEKDIHGQTIRLGAPTSYVEDQDPFSGGFDLLYLLNNLNRFTNHLVSGSSK